MKPEKATIMLLIMSCIHNIRIAALVVNHNRYMRCKISNGSSTFNSGITFGRRKNGWGKTFIMKSGFCSLRVACLIGKTCYEVLARFFPSIFFY